MRDLLWKSLVPVTVPREVYLFTVVGLHVQTLSLSHVCTGPRYHVTHERTRSNLLNAHVIDH